MKDLLKLLDRTEDLSPSTVYTEDSAKLPFELMSGDFISFAVEDLGERHERSNVNALSNVKRAIDRRVESLLYRFGVHLKAKRENWNFPRKVEFLVEVGVVAPNILRKISKKRNEMEHDFKKPTREDVEDFLDVANLFLHYTERLASKKYTKMSWRIGGRESWLKVKLMPEKGVFKLTLQKGEKEKSVEYSIDDEDEYAKVLRRWVQSILTG